MGYVPLMPKVGKELKREESELVRKIYVRTADAIWVNEYTRTKAKGDYYSVWSVSSVYLDRKLSTEEINSINKAEENEAIRKIFEDNEKIGGFSIHPPTDLSYKDLVSWYEASILGVIKKQTQLAIDLGQDPKEVGKIVVQSTQLLVQTSTAVFSIIGAGAGVTSSTAAAVSAGATTIGGASFAAVLGPIGGLVVAIVGALAAFGLFDGDTSKREADAVTYSQLTFVLKKWYEGYAYTLAKLNAIDLAEFNKYMQDKYGTSNQQNGNSVNTPLVNNSSPDSNTNYWYWGLALALLILTIILIRKR